MKQTSFGSDIYSYTMPSQTQDDVDMGDSQVNEETMVEEFDPTDNGALPRDNDMRLKLVSIEKTQ